jgi:hypothetical protein
MGKNIHVHILTFCVNRSLFYGTELVFKTLRVGFPNAKVTVTDNASLPSVRAEIKAMAKDTGCFFKQIESNRIEHFQFIQDTIRYAAKDKSVTGPLVFIDPDVCFWNSCEDFEFEGLMAGRFIDGFKDGVQQCITMPRVHTSFLWIPDARSLQRYIWKTRAIHFDFDPFKNFSFVLDGLWYRYDTGANLYASISDRVSHFTAMHLDCYDHLFGGSHIDVFEPFSQNEEIKIIKKIHECAKKGDLRALKGIHKRQETLFAEARI